MNNQDMVKYLYTCYQDKDNNRNISPSHIILTVCSIMLYPLESELDDYVHTLLYDLLHYSCFAQRTFGVMVLQSEV